MLVALTLDEALGGLVEEDKTEALQCFLGNLQAVKSEISWEKRQMLLLSCFCCVDGSFRSVLLDHLIVRGWVM